MIKVTIPIPIPIPIPITITIPITQNGTVRNELIAPLFTSLESVELTPETSKTAILKDLTAFSAAVHCWSECSCAFPSSNSWARWRFQRNCIPAWRDNKNRWQVSQLADSKKKKGEMRWPSGWLGRINLQFIVLKKILRHSLPSNRGTQTSTTATKQITSRQPQPQKNVQSFFHTNPSPNSLHFHSSFDSSPRTLCATQKFFTISSWVVDFDFVLKLHKLGMCQLHLLANTL